MSLVARLLLACGQTSTRETEVRVPGSGAAGENRGATGLPAATVKEVVVAHAARLRACFAAEANGTPTLAGTVTMRWAISPDGAVSGASVANSTLGRAGVEDCIVREVAGWTFPKSDVPTKVQYPFRFGVASAPAPSLQAP